MSSGATNLEKTWEILVYNTDKKYNNNSLFTNSIQVNNTKFQSVSSYKVAETV
jgi:hypothetical protein